MNSIDSSSTIDHAGLWRGEELWARDDWEIRLTADEIDQLERAVAGCADREVDEIGQEHFVLGSFSERLKLAQCQLENGAGFVYVRGLPVNRFDEGQLRRLFWGIAIYLGAPVSQSAAGERLFSVADAGYAPEDARSRGPNTSRKLSFHTDRCDVIGFCCHRQAKQGGENYIVSSMALYNAILESVLSLQPMRQTRHHHDYQNVFHKILILSVSSLREEHPQPLFHNCRHTSDQAADCWACSARCAECAAAVPVPASPQRPSVYAVSPNYS